MSFRSPAVLLLAAVLVPAALAAFAYAARQRAAALQLFLGRRADAGPTLGPLARQRTVRAGLIAGALGAAAVALAGPRVGTATRESQQESLDLLIALDVSDSMRAEDVAPSRLERAKLEVERVVSERRGDRVGLVVFAGEAFLQCPLTTDRGALRLFLDAAGPEQVAVQGTDFARALAVAEQAFNAAGEGQQDRPRALLVVSDGEDHEGGLDAEADALRDDGVTVLALGVGTDEGAPVPEVYRGRPVGDRRDRQGQPVITRYEPGALEDLAGGGEVVRVGRRPAAPQVNAALDGLDRAVVSTDEVSAEAERFQWPLALAVLLLLTERAVALRRPRDPDGPGGAPPPPADPGRPSEPAGRSGVPLATASAVMLAVAACGSWVAFAAVGTAPPGVVVAGLVGLTVYATAGAQGLGRAVRSAGAVTAGGAGWSAAGLAGWLGATWWAVNADLSSAWLALALAGAAAAPLAVLVADRVGTRRTPGRVTVAAGFGLVVLSGCGNPFDALRPGVQDGRAGVELLEAGDAEGAEAALVSALATPDVPRDVEARLWQALGVARARQDRFAEADSAFAQALARADASDQRARYAFDAGTAALLADDPARADSLLRRALLLAPASPQARRNQEIARRRLQDPPETPEPSDFAERVKAQADSLVGVRQYRAALDVMTDGLAQDPSVAAYADFTQRLGGVVEIEESVPAARDTTLP